MAISATEKISERVRLYLSGEDQKFTGFESDVRELNALPIYLDFLTDYFLRPDGVLFSRIEWEKPEIVKDTKVRIMVINRASEWFPELKELLPTRPIDAGDCPDCAGIGRLIGIDDQQQRVSVPCPKCMSLGWVQDSPA
jgi:hypothetical protein